MHNTILDLRQILASKTKPTILHLNETRHSHIKSLWREALQDYKLIHTSPKLYPATDRRSAGTMLVICKDICKDAASIPTPTHLSDYIKAATNTPHDGFPIVAIAAYVSQIHTNALELTYKDILSWIQQDATT